MDRDIKKEAWATPVISEIAIKNSTQGSKPEGTEASPNANNGRTGGPGGS